MRVLLLLCFLVGAALADENVCNVRRRCPPRGGGGGVSHLKTAERTLTGSFHIISTPLLRLGVVGPGILNAYETTFPSINTDSNNPVGLRYLGSGTENDGTAPGCYCEGYGVSGVWSGGNSSVGYADQSSGFFDITHGIPVPTGSGADTTATIGGSTGFTIDVKHEFRQSSHPNAFEVKITLTNRHPLESITRLRYERQMDWDIYPTTFAECVDIDLGSAKDLPCAHNDGFTIGNPDTDFPSPDSSFVNLGDCGLGNGTFPRTLMNHGPDDQGAAFLIQFHDITSATPLGPNESKSFLMYYGAAANKAAAAGVVGALSMEAYSFGYPSATTESGDRDCSSSNTGAPNTYIWGFAGLGGPPIPCFGTGCAHTSTCSHATSAVATTTTATCATISFDGVC